VVRVRWWQAREVCFPPRERVALAREKEEGRLVESTRYACARVLGRVPESNCAVRPSSTRNHGMLNVEE
jgi:hypothetical protein